MGSEVEMILSSAGSSCSMRLAAYAQALGPTAATPPAAAEIASICRRDTKFCMAMTFLPDGSAH
jgi:hypothetical protein